MSYDVVLLGATGFAGRLTAHHLARHAPEGLRWAVAGRDPARLAAVVAGLPAGSSTPGTVVVDVGDVASVRAAAEQTRVLVTTVGPYGTYGDAVVAACAETGTDYCDLTGEPEFVDRTWLRHHERATQTGARLVHACGFDSVPHDLGAYATVRRLPDDVPLTVRGYVTADAEFSGGTYHSAINQFGRMRAMRSVAAERRRAERAATPSTGRRVHGLGDRPVRGPGGKGWGVPLPTIDPMIVQRSARALPDYGPDFSYGHYAHVRRLPKAAIGGIGLLGVVAAAQVPPLRSALLRLKSPGDGPSDERRARSWYRVRFVGEGGGEQVVTDVTGGDPGYDETARMLGESALCLALDDLPETAGQVTTAAAMGDALLRRLDFVTEVDPASL